MFGFGGLGNFLSSAIKPPQGQGTGGYGGGFGFGGGGGAGGFLPMLLSGAGQNLQARAGPQIVGQPQAQPQGGGFSAMQPWMMSGMMGGMGGGMGMGLPPQILQLLQDRMSRVGQGGAGQNVYGPQQPPGLFNRIFTPPPPGGYR